jgi:hypothetical protein
LLLYQLILNVFKCGSHIGVVLDIDIPIISYMTNYHKANMKIWVLLTLAAYLACHYSSLSCYNPNNVLTYIKFYQCPKVAIKKIHNYNDNMWLLGWRSNLATTILSGSWFAHCYTTFFHDDLLDTPQHHNSFMMIFTHFGKSKIYFIIIISFFHSFFYLFRFIFFAHSLLLVCICLFLNVVIFSRSFEVVCS